jgi:universal stress protein A
MTTFSKALVAVDLEEASAHYVLESARQLLPGVPLSVLHVLERSHFYNIGDPSSALVNDLHTRITAEIGNYLTKLCDAHGIDDRHLREGHPATVIAQFAEEHGYDLIVLGTHGRHGIKRLLGSTVNGVLHGVQSNVLAVRVPGKDVTVPPAKDKYRHVVTAVDLSHESHQVLDVAQAVGERERAEIHVLHVIKPFQHAYAGINPATLSDVGIRFEQEADQQARGELRKIALSRGLSENNMQVRHGSPAREIQDLLDELRADLLVIGSHGQKGMELLLGSVANAVIHGIQCDVLAVRVR